MKKLKNGMLTASEVCNQLGISVKTLTNWYKWYYDDNFDKPENIPELPMYIQTHKNGPRFWTEQSLQGLHKFHEFLPKGRNGIMGEFSKRYWPARKEDSKENV